MQQSQWGEDVPPPTLRARWSPTARAISGISLTVEGVTSSQSLASVSQQGNIVGWPIREQG